MQSATLVSSPGPHKSMPRSCYTRGSPCSYKLLSSISCPPVEPIFAMASGTPQAMKTGHSLPNSLSMNSGCTCVSATIGLTTSLIPSNGLPTDQPLLYSLIISGPFGLQRSHGWLPVGAQDRRCGSSILKLLRCWPPGACLSLGSRQRKLKGWFLTSVCSEDTACGLTER